MAIPVLHFTNPYPHVLPYPGRDVELSTRLPLTVVRINNLYSLISLNFDLLPTS